MSLSHPLPAAAAICEPSSDRLSLALLSLSQCHAVYSGNFSAAVSQLTRAAAEALTVERVGVWLYQNRQTQLIEANTYLLSQHRHASGHRLQMSDYPQYFAQRSQRSWLVLNDIAEQVNGFTQRWLSPRDIGAMIEVPIRQHGHFAGVVWYEHVGSSRLWQPEERSFAIAIANLVALALETQHRQQQQTSTEQQQQQALLLKDTLRIVSNAPSDSSVLEQMISRIGQTFAAERCQLWRSSADAPEQAIPVAAYAARPALVVHDSALSLGEAPFLKRARAQMTPITSKDPDLPSQRLRPSLGPHWVVVPTPYQGTINGFVSLQLPTAEAMPTEPALALLQDLAMTLGIALAHTQMLAQEKQQQGTLSRQHQQLRREMIERQQAEQAWQESQRFIQSILDASTNILYVNHFDTGENFYINRCIQTVLGYGPEEWQTLGAHFLEQLVHPDDLSLMRAQRYKLEHLSDSEIVESEYRLRHCQGSWRWLLCRETVFQRDANGHPTQVFGTATDITERKQAEVALHEVNRELQRLASIDGLTQVANRRSFDEHIHSEWESLRHRNTPLTLILCDIDYFKRYNDEYGHQSGDICLKKVAQAINRAVKRGTDLVARYGGEEFAIVLTNTNLAGAERVAEEIQYQIDRLAIPHCQSVISDQITVSLGIATIATAADASPDSLIAAADRGLYRAKYEGRNRTCVERI
ncbi:MAG: diguanylate cyclase [Cyanobacteria bacterium J06554_6]